MDIITLFKLITYNLLLTCRTIFIIKIFYEKIRQLINRER